MIKSLLKPIVFLTALLALNPSSNAQRRGGAAASLGGDMSLAFSVSSFSASQDDMNRLIDAAVSGAGANTKNMGSGLEFSADWIYKLDRSMFSFVARPSYFTQSVKGSGTGGSFNYGLSGYTLFPILRITPLENSFIKFYLQGGVGYGSLTGDITAGARNVNFSGGAFGAMSGLGVNFCFTDAHCIVIEGNLRYLPIERNISRGGNCTTSGDVPGVTQCASGSELELNNSDLKTTLSGVQGLIGYQLNF